MRIRITYDKKFVKRYGSLVRAQRVNVDRAIIGLERYFGTGTAPVGLGLKKLCAQVYEIRAGIDLRIVFILDEPDVFLRLIGSHDEVRLFLKNI